MQTSLNQKQTQNQSLKQSQKLKMSMRQIQSLNLLNLPFDELRDEIYKTVEKNPALEIEADSFQDGETFSYKDKSDYFSDNTRYSSFSNQEATDEFYKALDNTSDERRSLSDYLFHQLNMLDISKEKKELCSKLIENLGAKGFHILAPVSLLQKNNPIHTEKFLAECEHLLQKFDPIGVCCNDISHSLLIQALDKKNVPEAAIFILRGHLDFLDPPIPSKILKKVNRYIQEKTALEFSNEDSSKDESLYPELDEVLPNKLFDENDIKDAIAFIKTLDPNPTRDFVTSKSKINYALPDVIVKKIPKMQPDSDGRLNFKTPDSLIVSEFCENCSFSIECPKTSLPILKISNSFSDFAHELQNRSEEKMTESEKASLKFSKDSIQSATAFIENIDFRYKTVLSASFEIVKRQHAFFEKGSRYLVPLRQKDVAGAIGVDDSTISRMANGKYLLCDWGLFPFSYFFTNAVNEATVQNQKINNIVGEESSPTSKEGVKFEIKKILEEHKSDKKPLSDQKISDILSQRGIKIARRTVAKYRSELNIESSFSRT